MAERFEKISDKKQDILKATLRLITQKGFHGTPMSMIASEAQVGAGTIYRYFANKEDLINELYSCIKAQLIQIMLKDYSETYSIRENFRYIYINTLSYYISHPDELTFGEQYTNSPFIYTSTREENIKLFAPIITLFEKAKKEHIIKDMPTVMLWTLMFGIIKSHARLHIDQKVNLNDEMIEKSMLACWDALKL